MGWTQLHKDTNLSVKDFFKQEFGENTVVDCAVVAMNVAYIAYRLTDGSIIGMICLLKYDKKEEYYNFSYKDMSEDMQPYYYDCPEKILKQLTGSNTEWREKCWANINAKKSLSKKLIVGNTIEFTDDSQYVVISVSPLRLRAENGKIYRVTKKVLMERMVR